MHDDLLANMPEGVRHDSDTCPFCVDKAAQSATTSRIPPAESGGPDVSGHKSQHEHTEGGTSKTMSDISQETHDALLQKAVADAISTTEKALATKTEEAAELTGKVTKLEEELEAAKADNERLNKELDTSQVTLKAAQDEVASLKADIAKKDEEAEKAEIAQKRTEQVKNLGLFADEYVTEKAKAWAELSDESWSERLEEWAKLKPAGSGDSTKDDTASAMSGTSDGLTKDSGTDKASEETDKKPGPRRAVLGLLS